MPDAGNGAGQWQGTTIAALEDTVLAEVSRRECEASSNSHFCEFEIRFTLDPGLGIDASLRGHCRIARWLNISACVGRSSPVLSARKYQ